MRRTLSLPGFSVRVVEMAQMRMEQPATPMTLTPAPVGAVCSEQHVWPSLCSWGSAPDLAPRQFRTTAP